MSNSRLRLGLHPAVSHDSGLNQVRGSHLQTAWARLPRIAYYSADYRRISSRTISGIGLRLVFISATPADSCRRGRDFERQLLLPVYIASYEEKERKYTLSFNGYFHTRCLYLGRRLYAFILGFFSYV